MQLRNRSFTHSFSSVRRLYRTTRREIRPNDPCIRRCVDVVGTVVFVSPCVECRAPACACAAPSALDVAASRGVTGSQRRCSGRRGGMSSDPSAIVGCSAARAAHPSGNSLLRSRSVFPSASPSSIGALTFMFLTRPPPTIVPRRLGASCTRSRVPRSGLANVAASAAAATRSHRSPSPHAGRPAPHAHVNRRDPAKAG